MAFNMAFKLAFSVLILGICCLFSAQGFGVTSETELRVALMTNYSSKVRPEGTVNVQLLFQIITVNSLDARTQTFSVSGVFTMVWHETRLVWNESDYGGIKFIFGTGSDLWKPAFVVENSVNDLSVINDAEVPFRVEQTGTVVWTPPGIYQTHCNIDITYYPFDTQECYLKLQSIGYNLIELNTTVFGNGVDLMSYKPNGEWDMKEATALRSILTGSVDANSYSSVLFKFTMSRKAQYYGMNVILPIIVLSVLSSMVFILPPESGEKMGFSLTVLLAFAVLLTLIADNMPTTSQNTSIMGVYLGCVLCLSGLSVMASVWIMEIWSRDENKPVPRWTKKFVTTIAIVTCIPDYLPCMRNKIKHTDENGSTNLKLDTVRSAKRSKTDHEAWGLSENVKVSHKEEVTLSWKDVAVIWDAIFFRVYVVTLIAVTVVCFLMLAL